MVKNPQAMLLATFLALLVSVGVSGAEEPYFKVPVNFNGTGCPEGSAVITGANSPMLTLMFNQYDAAKPYDKARSKMERASCNFAVPVHVPSGYQVSLITADWMGYAEGTTELLREYFFAGAEGIRKTSNPSGDYIERDDGLKYSSCGEDVLLRINSAVRADSADSYISVDSIDMQNGVIFHLQWEKCGPLALPAVLHLLL